MSSEQEQVLVEPRHGLRVDCATSPRSALVDHRSPGGISRRVRRFVAHLLSCGSGFVETNTAISVCDITNTPSALECVDTYHSKDDLYE